MSFSTAQQHALKLRRYEQYQEALANDRAFQALHGRSAAVGQPVPQGHRHALGRRRRLPHHRRGPGQAQARARRWHSHFWRPNPPADGNAGALVTTRERARELATDKGIEVELLSFGQHREAPGYMPAAPAPLPRRPCSARASPWPKSMPSRPTTLCGQRPRTGADLGFPWAHEQLRQLHHLGPPAGTHRAAWRDRADRGWCCAAAAFGLFTGCAAGDTGLATVIRVTDSR